MFKLPRRLPAGLRNLHPIFSATRAGTHTQTRAIRGRTFARRSYVLALQFHTKRFCHQYGNKKWMEMMKIKPWLRGSSDQTKWAMTSLTALFHVSSSLVLHRVIWLLISSFETKRKDLFRTFGHFYWQRGLYGNWGPSERLPKKCLIECGRFNYSSHTLRVWKPLGSKPPSLVFDCSQVKVSFCVEGFVCVSLVDSISNKYNWFRS